MQFELFASAPGGSRDTNSPPFPLQPVIHPVGPHSFPGPSFLLRPCLCGRARPGQGGRREAITNYNIL